MIKNSLWTCCTAEIILARNKIYCFVLNVDFHTNDLVESNYRKINAFKNISKMRFVDESLKNLDNLENWKIAWHLLYFLCEVLFIS